MNKFKVVGLVMLAALFFLSINSLAPTSTEQRCGVSRAEAAQIIRPITEWEKYYDPDFQIGFEYPASWEINTTIEQPVPYIDPHAILKRYTMIGNEGFIDLDIWSLNGKDFASWLEWYGQSRLPLPVTEFNARIAGNEAIAYKEDGGTADSLAVFWSDEEHVYRLWYTVSQLNTGLDVYFSVLNSFVLPGKEATLSEIPDDVKQSALKAADESGVISPLVISCCGYVDYGNPFPCCPTQPSGNCTWWVYYKYGYVPFRLNAHTWWDQVPDYYDWSRSGGPQQYQENIAWWDKAPSNNNYGHVAYAAYYSGGSDIAISQMAWCGYCAKPTEIPRLSPDGYIWERYPPQP